MRIYAKAIVPDLNFVLSDIVFSISRINVFCERVHCDHLVIGNRAYMNMGELARWVIFSVDSKYAGLSGWNYDLMIKGSFVFSRDVTAYYVTEATVKAGYVYPCELVHDS